eukprot:g58429.t1
MNFLLKKVLLQRRDVTNVLKQLKTLCFFRKDFANLYHTRKDFATFVEPLLQYPLKNGRRKFLEAMSNTPHNAPGECKDEDMFALEDPPDSLWDYDSLSDDTIMGAAVQGQEAMEVELLQQRQPGQIPPAALVGSIGLGHWDARPMATQAPDRVQDIKNNMLESACTTTSTIPTCERTWPPKMSGTQRKKEKDVDKEEKDLNLYLNLQVCP